MCFRKKSELVLLIEEGANIMTFPVEDNLENSQSQGQDMYQSSQKSSQTTSTIATFSDSRTLLVKIP